MESNHAAISSWFLGPQAENFHILEQIFSSVLANHAQTRVSYHPEDYAFITQEIQSSPVFQQNVEKLQTMVTELTSLLNTYSVPFYSPRYNGHMSMESSLPSIVGYIATMLFNPNNVAFEASPITTRLELDVGEQLCQMLGYDTTPRAPDSTVPKPWGHIASDGTLANMESMWVARNLKFYALSLRDAMAKGNPLDFVGEEFKVTTCDERELSFTKMEAWDLLNLKSSEILSLGDRLHEQYGISSQYLDDAMKPFIVQSQGKDELAHRWGILPPQYLISATKHYSWPKSAALVGIGSSNCVDVEVDNDARIDIGKLSHELEQRFEKKQAVYAVVCIIGSTEEGAVDPLRDVLNMRAEYEARGMTFLVHADAAWGGYFASMIREQDTVAEPDGPGDGRRRVPEQPDVPREFVPEVTLRESTVTQFHALAEADSITVDPHKSGYIPYPAGGLCYRDGRARYLVTWTAPYLRDADDGESIGVYGIEGSKPGAQAAAVYLHHAVVGLHKKGHGALLGEVSFTCRRLAAIWSAMSTNETTYMVVPFNPLPCEDDPEKLEEVKELIRKRIYDHTNEQVWADEGAMEVLCTLGSDLNINTFACNFRINGEPNRDVEEANYLNKRIFDRLAVTTKEEEAKEIPMFLSGTTFGEDNYAGCARHFRRRMQLEDETPQELFVLRNVVMSPFASAGGFVSQIRGIFKTVVEEETEHVIARNTITNEDLTFTMQGVDELFLAYRPQFHRANSRYQLILRATVLDEPAWSSYQREKSSTPSTVFALTIKNETIDALVQGKEVGADITGGETTLSGVSVRIENVVKKRRLDSMFRDAQYPETFIPFYMYGSGAQMHVDHALLRAPNAQISSDQVTITLDGGSKTSLEDITKAGAMVLMQRSERSMQPFSADSLSLVFNSGRSYPIQIIQDPAGDEDHGPLFDEPAHVLTRREVEERVGSQRLASGTITFGGSTYTEDKILNIADFVQDGRVASGGDSKARRVAWRDLVRERLGGVARGHDNLHARAHEAVHQVAARGVEHHKKVHEKVGLPHLAKGKLGRLPV